MLYLHFQNVLKEWLAHPLTRGLELDDPCATELRKRVLKEKKFLRRVYEEWYTFVAGVLPDGVEPVLEIGSGGSFLREFVPGLVCSELFFCPGMHAILDGQALPYKNGSLRAIVMTNVLHHLSRPRAFFAEASRCVRLGGAIVMVEPWVTSWSKLVYGHLHHEPFQPESPEWEFQSAGPLSGANQALPWIIFERDRGLFEKEFPQWRVENVTPLMPFLYLVSGGISTRSLLPGWTFSSWRKLESLLEPWSGRLGMFAQIILRRVDCERPGWEALSGSEGQ